MSRAASGPRSTLPARPARVRYVNGQRDGEWTYRYASGVVQEQGHYLTGKRDGEWMQYHSNGKTLAHKVYAGGVLEGAVKVWSADGVVDPEASGRYAGGKRTGPLGG